MTLADCMQTGDLRKFIGLAGMAAEDGCFEDAEFVGLFVEGVETDAACCEEEAAD